MKNNVHVSFDKYLAQIEIIKRHKDSWLQPSFLPSGLELMLMTGQNSVMGFPLNLVFQ